MGNVHSGVPRELAANIQAACDVDTFIETGTYLGETTAWAAERFKRVITIEINLELHLRACERFSSMPHVECLQGDSRTVLDRILPQMKGSAPMIWLDAHTCGGEDQDSPLLEEIEMINRHCPEASILIDDARFILAAIDGRRLCTLGDLIRALDSPSGDRYLAVFDDVVIAVPNRARPVVDAYVKQRCIDQRKAYEARMTWRRSLRGRVVTRLQRLSGFPDFSRIRSVMGALALDIPRLAICLAYKQRWIYMRNRGDRVSLGPGGEGVRCDWEYSRPLHVCNVFPVTGRWLCHRALNQWHVELDSRVRPNVPSRPDVSFVIGHRGLDRLELLLMTLDSIRCQREAAVECIVVEQDEKPQIQSKLPSWVRYLHAPISPRTDYNRSAAFNAGARLAKGDVLVLHDNDLLVPLGYAAECWRRYREGFEVSQLFRFLFYLDRRSTEKLISGKIHVQNAKVVNAIENVAGGSLAISRSAFEAIGGMDEEFYGWGGEDNEFLDRCMTRNIWRWGYLPAVHLWHRTVADRSSDNPALVLWRKKAQVLAATRIASLLVAKTGDQERGAMHTPVKEGSDAHHS